MDAELRKILAGDALEARFRELSAEEREKQAKDWQKQQKAARKRQRKARRRRAFRRTAWGLAAIVLAGGGTYAYLRYGHGGGPDDTQTIAHGAVPRGLKTSAPRPQSGPPADPFSGTPADKWADGAAGITLPAAKPAGQYSAAQVEDAYQTTRKMLVAAALDPQTLNGGAPTAFAKLLTQDQRTEFLGGLNKIGTDKYHVALSTRSWITQFAPGTTKLIGSVVKVHGTMSATTAKEQSGQTALRITVDYLVAYPVEPPKAPEDWMRVVSQFSGTVDFASWSDAESPFEPWWNANPAPAGGRCGTRDGYVHPDFPGGPADMTPKKGRIINPYALSPPSGTPGCGQTTGT
jgi:hypothetical protein